jgi:hypothetical protein
VIETNLHAQTAVDETADRETVTPSTGVTETVDPNDVDEGIANTAAAATECKVSVTHEMHALALNNLGEVCHARGMDTVATAYFERALDVLHSAR